jgi:alpha-tubulin suppressor-like RCC1 family protein
MGVVAIAAGHGGNTSYALKSDGTVWAWGYDAIGELGDGTADLQPHPTPTKVSNLTGVIAIGAGADHGLALESDGTVWAWGFNLYGQLGATTTTTCVTSQYPCSTVPVKVSNLSGVTAVAGGQNFSLALKSDGTVWCWGDNGYGQCANGTTSGSSGVAKPTEAHLSSITAIAAGANHTMALKSNGTVWAAGYGRLGQLGTGAFTDSSTPVQVIKVSGMIVIGAGMNHSLAVEV